MQLVLMSIEEGQEIGREKHQYATQFIRVESGRAKAIVGKNIFILKDGDAIVVPPNTYHNIINTGKDPLKLYTIYSPPQHNKNTVEKNKTDL
jgi:mannose-6-phosphate isomerase-like protein (cupin superfamily)